MQYAYSVVNGQNNCGAYYSLYSECIDLNLYSTVMHIYAYNILQMTVDIHTENNRYPLIGVPFQP